jgi:uncharacterized SAM-binding protein YcdF (DUF218 family)
MRRLRLKILLAVVVLFAVLGLLAWFFPDKILTVDSGPVKADVLVVLGGGGSHERPQRAVELFKEGAARLVICSGKGDCAANAQRLISMGVPAGLIEEEDKSSNTLQNAQFTVVMLRAQHVRSAIIVTSWYHSRRALACFRHFAPEIKFYSRPSLFAYERAEWVPKGVARIARREYLKLLGYWVRHGVWPF